MESGNERQNSIDIHAGGDVIGVGVNGDNNSIGKNMTVTQTNTQFRQITIDEHILSRLDQDYANVFKKVTESLNEQLRQSNSVKGDQVVEIKKSLEDLARETEGLKAGQPPPDDKKKVWIERLKVFTKNVMNTLPKAAATAAITPILAVFSKGVEYGLQQLLFGLGLGD